MNRFHSKLLAALRTRKTTTYCAALSILGSCTVTLTSCQQNSPQVNTIQKSQTIAPLPSLLQHVAAPPLKSQPKVKSFENAVEQVDEPNIGLTLKHLRIRLASFLSSDDRLADYAKNTDEELGEGVINFQDDTKLYISNDSKNKVTSVELDGSETNPSLFWKVAAALVQAVDSTARPVDSERLLRKLGKLGPDSISDDFSEADYQGLNYVYSRSKYSNGCSLTVQKTIPGF